MRSASLMLALVGLSAAALGIGCARGPGASVSPVAPAEDRAAPAPPPSAVVSSSPSSVAVSWPAALLVDEHAGPTLHRRSGPSTGYGWVEPGSPVRLRGEVRDGRARAVVDGPLMLRGWIDVAALGAVVLTRGRVDGTPVYLVPGDLVSIEAAEGERAEVSVAARFGHPGLPASTAFTGHLPLDRLGAEGAGGGAGATVGETRLLRRATALYLDPRRDPAYQIPALEPPMPAVVLRERGAYVGVRIGIGPYLVGYVRRDVFERAARKQDMVVDSEVLNPWEHVDRNDLRVPDIFRRPWPDEGSDEAPVEEEQDDPAEASGLPPRLYEAAVRPVWEIAPGTRVRVEGAVVALFREPGLAVELGRAGSTAQVLAAADETATVRGDVSLSALTVRHEPGTHGRRANQVANDSTDARR